MSNPIKSIQTPIAKEMKIFESKFKESMKSRIPLLNKISYYIVKRKGKQVRPMFVFLVAGMLGKISERTYRGAALIELLHTASLVHDDVVDDAEYRRGFFSINALWKNKIAVLVGDFLLSKGLLLSVEHKDFDLLEIVSDAVRLMSEGELLQIEKARNLNQTEEIYYEIIRQKTASLISSCCAVGACSVHSNPEIVKKALDFGEKIGLAFQIKDDLFDYGKDEIGKPLGIDIKEKKLTLPLIYALSKAPKSESKQIKNLVRNKSNQSKTIDKVLSFVKNYDGLIYAEKVMNEYYQQALDLLYNFEKNIYRDALEKLLEFTIVRSK